MKSCYIPMYCVVFLIKKKKRCPKYVEELGKESVKIA